MWRRNTFYKYLRDFWSCLLFFSQTNLCTISSCNSLQQLLIPQKVKSKVLTMVIHHMNPDCFLSLVDLLHIHTHTRTHAHTFTLCPQLAGRHWAELPFGRTILPCPYNALRGFQESEKAQVTCNYFQILSIFWKWKNTKMEFEKLDFENFTSNKLTLQPTSMHVHPSSPSGHPPPSVWVLDLSAWKAFCQTFLCPSHPKQHHPLSETAADALHTHPGSPLWHQSLVQMAIYVRQSFEDKV